jgi:hypothetical protein
MDPASKEAPMYTGHETTEDPGLRPQEKLDLLYAYLGIEDSDKFWKEASFRAKTKVVLFMFIFNFILVYKFFRNQPLVKEQPAVE